MNKVKLLQLAKLVAKFAEISTDKAALTIDGELAVGAEVFVEVEGELKPAEDGDYATDDMIITIAEGKVAEIREVEVEEAPAEEAPVEEEKPADEEMEVEVPVEEAPVEEIPETDPRDEKIAELEAALVAKDEMIAELEAKLAALEEQMNKPVEEPVQMSKQLQTKNIEANPALKYFS